MGNSLLTVSQITRFSIPLFLNTNFFIMNIDRQYDASFGMEGAKIGAQLRIRLPNDYVVTDGPAISIQDTSEQQVVLTVATQRHVDVAFTTAERTLSLEDYAERILSPRVNVLAGNVAQTIMIGSEGGICNASANVDANNNILAVTPAAYTNGRALLADNEAPRVGWKVVNDPHTNSKIMTSMMGLLNPATEVSKQFREGQVYSGLGFGKWGEDQTVIKHTTGTLTSGTVNGAGQTGNAINVSPLGGTVNQGDIFTIAGVNAVNRTTKASTGQLRQFVATGNFASGATSISFYPALIPPANSNPYANLPYTAQQYQTVTAAPANNATITPFANASSTYRKAIACAPQCVTMVIAPLWMPPGGRGVIEAARHTMDNVSMRSLVCYEPGTDQPVDRLDVLFGFYYVRPEWGTQVCDSL